MVCPKIPPANDRLMWTAGHHCALIQIFLKSGTEEDPSWRKAVLELPQSAIGPRRCTILTRVDSPTRPLVRQKLASWVSLYYPRLKGNSKDCWFYCKDDHRFLRLQDLWKRLRDQGEQPAQQKPSLWQPAEGSQVRTIPEPLQTSARRHACR